MEESVKKNKKLNINLPVLIFIITAIVFAIPSITYLMKNKTIYGFYYVWTYFFNNPATKSEMLNNALMFFLLMTILFRCLLTKRVPDNRAQELPRSNLQWTAYP